MRLCIYGAGAVGGHLAAKLAAAGHEVGVIARGRLVHLTDAHRLIRFTALSHKAVAAA